MAHGVFSGCFFTVSLSLPQRLLPQNEFAQIVSTGGMIGCLVNIVFAPAMGVFLDLNDHAYRYTFCAGLLITVLALAANLVLHGKFLALGGPKNYVAP